MKLLQVLDEAQILEEGIRFTNREISKVRKNSKNILVAFEYEFTPIAEKMNAVRRGEEPTPTEETPREEVSFHDINDYEEYQEAHSEAEQEEFDDQFETKKTDYIQESEDKFREEYEGPIETIDAMTSKKRTFFQDQYPKIFRRVRNDLLGLDFSYKQLAQKLSDDSITEEELRMLASYVDIISDFKNTLQESYYMELIIDSDPEELDNMYTELWNTLRTNMDTPRNFTEFFTESDNNYDDVKDFMEDLNEVDEMPLFSEFSNPSQSAFVFDSLKQELNDIVENLDDNNITFESIRTTISFFEAFESVTVTDIDNDIFKYAEQDFNNHETEIREELWEQIWNYGSSYENVDLEQVIRDIQANHNVVVMNDDDEPFFPPYGPTARGGSGTSPNATKKFMIDYGEKWGLNFSRDFEPAVDQEGHGMVEFKSNPIPLEAALDLMHNMFNFINDIGDTSHGYAGLHTNMSIRGIKFDKKHFNPLKLLMLVDNELIHDLFPVRTHVADVFNSLSSDNLFNLAKTKGQNINNMMSYVIKQNEKFQGINFNHMSIEGDTRRVEFRYTGGKDYSHREKIIRWTVYRFAYALEAAFDDSFLEKEYQRDLIKFLDKQVNKQFNQFKSFEEMRSFIKKHDVEDTEELFSLKVGGMLKFDWTVYKHKDTDMIAIVVKDASSPMDVYDINGNKMGTVRREVLDDYEVVAEFKNKTRMEVVKKLKTARL